MDRIEKLNGHWVGYGRDGHVWRIARREHGGWLARCRDIPERNFVFGRTLAEVNAKLAHI